MEENNEMLNIKNDLLNNKNFSINLLDEYLNELINSNDTSKQKKAKLLSYWLKDYTKYLSEEDIYKNKSKIPMSYQRGDILKVNLGFNIGSEQGGLHYCIVVEKHNSRNSNTVTVIPLTSKKINKTYNPLNVDLGTEIYDKLNQKLDYLVNLPITDTQGVSLYTVGKLCDELKNMKEGSIALINQITTISKQRIYDPKNNLDMLYHIKLSTENLDKIDNKIKELFLK